MASTLGPLENGGRVVIIGGGPGGTSCALALHRLALERNRVINITLLEGKTFTGEHQYNQCAGVLSPPIAQIFADQLHIPFPYHLSKNQVAGYILHTQDEHITLDEEDESSVTLRRVQFDDFMLEEVRQRGIAVILSRVVDLEFHADSVMVYTDSGSYEADVVVGAFGLDEGSAALFSRRTSYRPPKAIDSVVTKYHPGSEEMKGYGSYIHAFLPRHPRIEFGAITPKGDHLTINIAGVEVNSSLMRTFLELPEVKPVLPGSEEWGDDELDHLCFFKGRFPSSLARNFYGDRFVMIGDAAGLVRAFKGKGITSAATTAIRASETILDRGCSESAFHDHYRQANRDIIGDLPYGRSLRLLTIYSKRYGLLDPVLRAAKKRQILQSALYDAVSANSSYLQVVKKSFSLNNIATIVGEMF